MALTAVARTLKTSLHDSYVDHGAVVSSHGQHNFENMFATSSRFDRRLFTTL